jgi:hypothetical protein
MPSSDSIESHLHHLPQTPVFFFFFFVFSNQTTHASCIIKTGIDLAVFCQTGTDLAASLGSTARYGVSPSKAAAPTSRSASCVVETDTDLAVFCQTGTDLPLHWVAPLGMEFHRQRPPPQPLDQPHVLPSKTSSNGGVWQIPTLGWLGADSVGSL